MLIAAVHHAAISVAYRGYFTHSPPPTVAELRAAWTARLADPTATAFLASRDGQPAGSVMARADPQFGEGQIVGSHVLPSQWGQRIGSALHDSALGVGAYAVTGSHACLIRATPDRRWGSDQGQERRSPCVDFPLSS
jgi:hypothetical protein